jgi:UMF1 family MFS transporter
MAEPSSSTSRLLASRFQVFIWTLYDFANTSFSVLILTVGYPLYFTSIVAAGHHGVDFLWGLAFSISMLITAIVSPVLGAIADFSSGKKRFLLLFTLLCIAATGLLYFVDGGMIVLGMFLLIAGNIGFEAGLVFYDSFLPEIATERSYGRVSGYGFAMGYVGSLATLAIAYPFLKAGFVPENLPNVRLSFVMAAAFFLVFSAPLFLRFHDNRPALRREKSYLQIGLDRVATTLRHIREYRNVGRFLLSYFVFIDGVNTVIVFASIFAVRTLHFDTSEVVLFFATVQTTAILGSVVFGILADHFGQKKTLTVTLLLWIIIVTLAFFVVDKVLFYVIGMLAGMAMGSSQSTSRSLYSRLIPYERKTEFFGFYSFFGKSSAVLGPFTFGLISTYFGQRLAVVSVALFFITGLILLQRVREQPAVAFSATTTDFTGGAT